MLLRSETNRPSADSTTILREWWLAASGLLQVVGDTTGVDKWQLYRGRHIGNNHNASAYSRVRTLFQVKNSMTFQGLSRTLLGNFKDFF